MQTPDAREQRPIDRWLARYAGDHVDPVNQRVHMVAVPLIVWSVVALLWCIPVPGHWFRPGTWAVLAMWLAWLFYHRASRPLGLGMLAVFALLGLLTHALHVALGTRSLLLLAVGVFVLAWIAQFVGHKIEGRRPSFLTDLTYLLVGPLWLLAKVYRRMGWGY